MLQIGQGMFIRNKKNIFIIYLFSIYTVLGLNTFFCNAQLNDSEVKTALIFNFIKFIEAEKIDQKNTINICYYGHDTTMSKLILKLEKEKVKNKKLVVQRYEDIEDLNEIDILFVFNEYNFEISKIFRSIHGKNVLLITDRYPDKKEIMINFIHKEEKVQFEINNKNISEANFTISPRLLLLGGTELDVRELYREVEESLKNEREKSELIEKELKDKQEEINNLIVVLSKLYSQNDSLNQVIGNQLFQIQDQKDELDTLQIYLKQTLIEVETRRNELKHTNYVLLGKNKEINSLDIQLSKKQVYIENATDSLDLLQNNIKDKEKILKAQENKIALQNLALYIFIAFFVLFIIFILYIYRNYRVHRRKNIELEKRNIKINRQKEQIQEQANDLSEANKELEKEKKRAEDALKKLKNAQSQLVAAEKMVSLGQLTSGIAHEINNPINYISSNIEGLRNIIDDFKNLINGYDKLLKSYDKKQIDQLKIQHDYDDLIPGFDELTANIKLGVDRTKEIVNSLRTFARVDDENFVVTDLHQNINSAILLMGKQNNDRITIIKEYGDIPLVECIPGKISQVFMNILVNAVQAIKKDNGKIIIKTEKIKKKGNHFVMVSVSDNGDGIREEIKDKIFEPFFTTKDVGEGTGLGLSISYSIIKKHNGFIEIESNPKKGTTFKIYLPNH